MKRTAMVRKTPMKRGSSTLARSAFKKSSLKKVRVPKLGGFPYVRSRALINLFKTLPCQVTGAPGPSDPSHSNWHVHGHYGGIKASDVFIAAMSRQVHEQLDQGNKWSQAEKQRIWWMAHVRSVRALVEQGVWPASIPVPDIETYPFPIASPAAQFAGNKKPAGQGGFVQR